MTKAEMVKAARDMPVRMGQADALREMNKIPTPAGALESWCPPLLRQIERDTAMAYAALGVSEIARQQQIVDMVANGLLSTADAQRALAKPARAKKLPAAAALCGLVMDGDRLPAHRDQCQRCEMVARIVREQRLTSIEDLDAARCFVAAKVQEEYNRLQKEYAPPPRACLGCASRGSAVPHTCGKANVVAPKEKPAEPAKREPTIAEKAAALPHLSGCDCSRCKVGRAAACCNIGWHQTREGKTCPFHVKVAAAPWVPDFDEWDLLPNA